MSSNKQKANTLQFMKLRNILLNMLTAVCIPQAAVAVPAYPHPIKVRQADGTFITIRLKGDERGHLAFTADGYPPIPQYCNRKL